MRPVPLRNDLDSESIELWAGGVNPKKLQCFALKSQNVATRSSKRRLIPKNSLDTLPTAFVSRALAQDRMP